MGYTGSAVIRAAPRSEFVETAYVKQVTARAHRYVQAGCPVHFRGPSGVGKTTLALHIAHQLGRPVMLMVGDDEFGSSDLIGRQAGYRRRRVVDHFVQSVLKTEDDVAPHWVDNRLTVACREGLTLVYDEFTRSRPEANNALLSVLEERVLVLPARDRDGTDCVPVHPDFVAIFTSNPVEYAGVHQAQDALFERIVTIDLESFDEATETAIVRARSGLSEAEALTVVRLVRASRQTLGGADRHTVRSAIVIARVLGQQGAVAQAGDPIFEQVCQDVLSSETGRRGWNGLTPQAVRQHVQEMICEHAPATASRRPARASSPARVPAPARPAAAAGQSSQARK
jgi:nitric oxide reductase NorQ protein